MGYSSYPNKVDGSIELPPTVDNVTPVKGEVVNRLRDAIIAIESELGVLPSGTYGTVRARLDAMEALLSWLIKKVTGGGTGAAGGVPTHKDKALSPFVTAGDGSWTGLSLTKTPAKATNGNAYVTVTINGLSSVVGNGAINRECYFSGDGGATARTYKQLQAGDRLYWNGIIANMELDPNDTVDFHYDVV